MKIIYCQGRSVRISIYLFIYFLLFFEAVSSVPDCISDKAKWVSLKNKYAQHFEIYKNKDNFIIVTISSQGDKTYYFSGKFKNKERKQCSKHLFITHPVRRFIGLSTTYIPSLVALNVHHTIMAFSGKRYISNKKINVKKIQEIGYPPKLEVLIKGKPDIIMGYSIDGINDDSFKKIKSFKLPFVLNNDFLEKSPLARSEWVKFISVFFGKYQEASSLFDEIANNYIDTKDLLKNIKIKKRIILGENVNGIWEAPKASSDFAKLVEDAGGDYFFKDKLGKVRISMEKVLGKIKKADFWIPQNNWRSLSALIKADRRYGKMNIVKEKKVFNNVNRWIKGGGNDYWETGMMRPDLILKDLGKIFYPHFFENYQLRWYKKLQ